MSACGTCIDAPAPISSAAAVMDLVVDRALGREPGNLGCAAVAGDSLPGLFSPGLMLVRTTSVTTSLSALGTLRAFLFVDAVTLTYPL